MLKERHRALDHPVTASFHDPTPPSRPSSLVDLPQKIPLGVAGNNTPRCPDRSTAGLYPTHRLKVQKEKQEEGARIMKIYYDQEVDAAYIKFSDQSGPSFRA
jgi:hypothetical protein